MKLFTIIAAVIAVSAAVGIPSSLPSNAKSVVLNQASSPRIILVRHQTPNLSSDFRQVDLQGGLERANNNLRRQASANKEDSFQRAKLAQQAERFDDMAKAMKSVAEQTGAELSFEEWELFSTAYKNVVGARRKSRKAVSNIEEKVAGNSQLAKEYRETIDKEIRDLSNEVLGLLDKFLIPKASKPELQVAYRTMKGDHYRYLAEVATKDTREAAVNEAKKAYEEADKISKAKLKPIDPNRLELGLSMSLYYYEILRNPDESAKIAKKVFDEGLADLDTLNEDAYKSSTRLLEVLRANYSKWTSDSTNPDAEDVESRINNRRASAAIKSALLRPILPF